jgi:hypothetical protein
MIVDTSKNMVGHTRVKKQLHLDKHTQTAWKFTLTDSTRFLDKHLDQDVPS